MEHLWRYQVEIVAAVALTASGFVVAVVWDYLLHHNLVGREQARDNRKAR